MRSICRTLILLFSSTVSIQAFEYEQGWPQSVMGGVDFSSPVVADVNDDETLDVLVASQGHYVYLWNHRGEAFPGWPRPVAAAPYDETSSPAVGDIDRDGRPEIVYGSASGRLYAWHVDSSLVPGFPIDLQDNVIRSAVTLEDIDRDDTLEILVGTGNAQSRFSVFRHDGTLQWSQTTAARIHSTPAVADLDRDGGLEIVVGNDGVSGQADVYAWHSNGTLVAGWPKFCGNHVDPGPALADVNQDGRYEVFAGSLNSLLYGLDYAGADLPGWPNLCGNGTVYEGLVSSPAIGDLDRDSSLEVVTGRGILQSSYGAVYAFRATGETLPGFPVNFAGSIVSSPVLADLDDDSDLEIVVGGQDGRVYALHHDGSAVAGFPIEVGAAVTSSPAIADIDRDGRAELAVGAKNDSLYVWDLGARYMPDRAPWPMFHHDARHTGRLPSEPPAVEEPGREVMRGSSLTARIVRGVLVLPASGVKREASSVLLDISGRKVLDLRPGPNDVSRFAPGVYFVVQRGSMSEACRRHNDERRTVKIVIQN
jgi:hypothetical protein